MLDMFLKKLVLFVGLSIFYSCNSTKIVQAEKFKVISGVPSGTPFLRYKIDLNVHNEIQFLEINIKPKLIINSFSVINLKTHMQSDNKPLYTNGKYRLQFDIPIKEQLLQEKDTVLITYKDMNKTEVLTTVIDTIKEFRLK